MRRPTRDPRPARVLRLAAGRDAVPARPVRQECDTPGVYSPRDDAPPAPSKGAAMPESDVTQLLRSVASGDRRDLNALMAAIYDDLRRLAVVHMKGERDDHTLQPTAVVHEAYLRLIDQRSTNWNDRAHFFSVASCVIRRILVDHARSRSADKRGGGDRGASLGHIDPAAPTSEIDLLALDEALVDLSELCPRQAQLVELRFFGGLTLDEIAEAQGIGRRSVDRDWAAAKAWLYCRLDENGDEDADEE